ncbi:MAG: M48 family metallopeptidase [Aggregatilineales bacterium]
MSRVTKPLSLEVPINTERLQFNVQPDTRLRVNARWSLRDNVVTLRVPRGMPHADLEAMIERIVTRIQRGRARADRQTDQDLMQRAAQLNAQYFDNELTWRTIRWAENMRIRLGSCTIGGTCDGDIRISTAVRRCPSYVLDYVIAHELCHRKHPDHSPEFWAYLARFPYAERARGFLEGVAFAGGMPEAD